MMPQVTAEENGTVRIEAEGGSATIRLMGERAQLLFMQLPEGERRKGKGRALLKAAEAEASTRSAKKLYCYFSDKAEGFRAFLGGCGYEMRETGSVLSVSIDELLHSAGVQKSLRMNFSDITTSSFENLLIFEREELSDLLNKLCFELPDGGMERYDYSLSFLSCDKNLSPKAVLLSTMSEKLMVELMLGFSDKSAEFILCACQEFARALMERMPDGGPERIYLYSCTDNTIKLIRRLLDRQYQLQKEAAVFCGEKALEGVGEPLERRLSESADAYLWRSEAEAVFAQRNVSEKAAWMELRSGHESD
ncbi:MAG: hypothetical protein J6O55_02995 [Lachnospiraceae bacterium]|nr:hypothetical protein [Lachnospiraceae bacterium]